MFRIRGSVYRNGFEIEIWVSSPLDHRAYSFNSDHISKRP
jgi:hypothetical protein